MEQLVVLLTLLLALVLFVTGWLRYDLVAVLALLIVTLAGIIPENQAFAGFGHPAVVTVAAVLIISQGLINAGVVDVITRWLSNGSTNFVVQLGLLVATVTICSAFMNNIGALALVMPVALRMARRGNYSPSMTLMPLAFGSLLGGMTTLIGTPPNVIIAGFRAQETGQSFGIFDFLPVGGAVAVFGGLFIVSIGWRLLPRRNSDNSHDDLFKIDDYITEVRVPESTPLAYKTLRQLHDRIEVYVVVVSIVRSDLRLDAPSSFEVIHPGDILVVETDSGNLQDFLNATGFFVEEARELPESGHEVSIVEVVVRPNSILLNRTARQLNMRSRYGLNMLAISRQGERLTGRLGQIRFAVGDVLLVQGRTDLLVRSLPELGCLAISELDLKLGRPPRLLLAVGILAIALGSVTAGWLSAQVALTCGVIMMIFTGIISLKEAYDSIEWPIIFLLGAMIPVGQALETSGAAATIANNMLILGQHMPPVVTLIALMVATMCLSDLINNAAAAVLMAPIGISLAHGLSASVDPFLITIAIGASCAFLTPIGHQSNTLVMGPGGYRFADYWRMGLPLEILIIVLSIPLITIFWPFVP